MPGAKAKNQKKRHKVPKKHSPIRRYLLTGVLITAPLAITIWLAYEFVSFADRAVGKLFPAKWNPETYLPFSVPGLGVLLVLVFLILVGMLTASLFGRFLVRQGEYLLDRVPIIRSVYSALKQVFQAVFSQSGTSFRDVAMLEFPDRGSWVVGFVANKVKGEIATRLNREMLAVFVPASPNPTTGFLFFLPREDVKILDIPIDQGIRVIISGGIVSPNGKLAEADHHSEEDLDENGEPKVKQPMRLRPGFWARMRTYLLTGILVTAPVAITFWLAWQVISFIDTWISSLLPPRWNPENYLPFAVPGLGLILLLATLIFVGMITTGMIGRWYTRISEWMLNRVPVIRTVYNAFKQIFETLFSQQSDAFRECVLVEFPRKSCWTLGFITGRAQGTVDKITGIKNPINIFIPTTPNPTTGFLVFREDHKIIPLELSVEDGFKLVLSGGIVFPSDIEAGEGDAETAIADEASGQSGESVKKEGKQKASVPFE